MFSKVWAKSSCELVPGLSILINAPAQPVPGALKIILIVYFRFKVYFLCFLLSLFVINSRRGLASFITERWGAVYVCKCSALHRIIVFCELMEEQANTNRLCSSRVWKWERNGRMGERMATLLTGEQRDGGANNHFPLTTSLPCVVCWWDYDNCKWRQAWDAVQNYCV